MHFGQLFSSKAYFKVCLEVQKDHYSLLCQPLLLSISIHNDVYTDYTCLWVMVFLLIAGELLNSGQDSQSCGV